jgi:hypothetical protein
MDNVSAAGDPFGFHCKTDLAIDGIDMVCFAQNDLSALTGRFDIRAPDVIKP